MEHPTPTKSKSDTRNPFHLQKRSSAQESTTPSHTHLIEADPSLTLAPSPEENDNIRHIQKSIKQIENQQVTLHLRCEKIIRHLNQEILLKQKRNEELDESIAEMKAELEASREDFNIIKEYLAKKKGKNNKSPSRFPNKSSQFCNLDSTKDSGRLEKSISGPKSKTHKASSSGLLTYKVRPSGDHQQPKTPIVRRNKSNLMEP